LSAIFTEIRTSGTPPRFTNEFLRTTLGFTSSADRATVKILRQLGFIDSNGVPSDRYNAYKENARALADGLRDGWSELFLSNRTIYTKTIAEISRKVASITGANEDISKRMAATFKSLCELADWGESSRGETGAVPSADDEVATTGPGVSADGQRPLAPNTPQGSFELHHDIHLHLPTTSDTAVYRAIFQAIKTELL
jgi:hypothetical protein